MLKVELVIFLALLDPGINVKTRLAVIRGQTINNMFDRMFDLGITHLPGGEVMCSHVIIVYSCMPDSPFCNCQCYRLHSNFVGC